MESLELHLRAEVMKLVPEDDPGDAGLPGEYVRDAIGCIAGARMLLTTAVEQEEKLRKPAPTEPK